MGKCSFLTEFWCCSSFAATQCIWIVVHTEMQCCSFETFYPCKVGWSWIVFVLLWCNVVHNWEMLCWQNDFQLSQLCLELGNDFLEIVCVFKFSPWNSVESFAPVLILRLARSCAPNRSNILFLLHGCWECSCIRIQSLRSLLRSWILFLIMIEFYS